MKNFAILLFVLAVVCKVNGQYTYISNQAFEVNLIRLGYDESSDNADSGNPYGADGKVLTSAIDTITHLILSYQMGFSGLGGLGGIEDFSSLKELIIFPHYEYGRDIDFANSSLEVLNVNRAGGVEQIEMSNFPSLKRLEMLDSDLDNLNLSSSENLEELYLENSPMSQIIFPLNSSLKQLILYANISSIDLSSSQIIEDVTIRSSELSSLDLSNNSSLNRLELITYNLSSLDVTNNLELKHLNLKCGITSLDLSNSSRLEFLKIESISEYTSELDLSSCVNLRYFEFQKGMFESVNLSNNINLDTIILRENVLLKSLDLSSSTGLKYLSLSYNTLLKCLNLVSLKDFEEVYIYSNNQALSCVQVAEGDIDWFKYSATFYMNDLEESIEITENCDECDFSIISNSDTSASNTITDTIYVTVEDTLNVYLISSVNEQHLNEVRIWNDNDILHYQFEEIGNYEILIFNSNAQMLYQNNHFTQSEGTYDLTGLAAGLYFITINDNDEVLKSETKKIVIR